MLPLLKILTLLFKVFSKPMITYTKKYHIARKNNHSTYSKRFFIFFGNKWNIIETRINRSFLNIGDKTNFKIKQMNENDALEKGLEYFYEIIFYAILLGIPIYEMRKSYLENTKKNTILNERLQSIEDKIIETKNNLIKENIKQNTDMGFINKTIEKFEEKISFFKEINENYEQNNSNQMKIVFNETKYLIDKMGKEDKDLKRLFDLCEKNQKKIQEKLL